MWNPQNQRILLLLYRDDERQNKSNQASKIFMGLLFSVIDNHLFYFPIKERCRIGLNALTKLADKCAVASKTKYCSRVICALFDNLQDFIFI